MRLLAVAGNSSGDQSLLPVQRHELPRDLARVLRAVVALQIRVARLLLTTTAFAAVVVVLGELLVRIRHLHELLEDVCRRHSVEN